MSRGDESGGYRNWQAEFDRHVSEGEQAIWIWALIITERCPRCENSESYHAQSDCEYDGTPPEEWERGLVAFKPVPVFDVSQTEGEPLPELETAARGEADGLVDRLLDAGDDLGVTATIVAADAWRNGDANGVCSTRHPIDCQPLVEVRQRTNRADVAGTLIHEYAHTELHFGTDDASERSKREVEAEAVAYVVGRHFGLDMCGSAFYLAAWVSADPTVVRDRLARISDTAQEIIGTVEWTPEG